jgi:2-oxo-4-hydroxy-4-carboxy-5-ureidoimidazoline decarboxylase
MLGSLNSLDNRELRAVLGKCCASPAWIERMLARRPFMETAEVAELAEEIWWSLGRDDWLAAFAAHPRIGDLNSLRAKFANTAAWASAEQASVAEASAKTLQELAGANRCYEERFGYLFIVCATGKSAQEMLDILKLRLANNEQDELRVAAAEQLKITLLRLEKLS